MPTTLQLEFGQPASLVVGVGTPAVVAVIPRTLPFLIALPGRNTVPLTLTATGFWPGTLLDPPGFWHSAVAEPTAEMSILMSPLPRPERLIPLAVTAKVVASLLKVGDGFLKCTLPATAAVDVTRIVTAAKARTTAAR